MNSSVRIDVVFSDHASVSLFECLIVAGAPATGLFPDVTVKDGGTVQMTLQLLRDMWQRADVLYIPRADLESLHRMECNSTGCHETPIPDQIALEARKLSRYYVYLLFRYCMSSGGLMRYNHQGIAERLTLMSPWKPKIPRARLFDVPDTWLQTKVCTNYPSAPPIPDGNFTSGLHHLIQQPSQQLPQPLPTVLENHRYLLQKPPQALPLETHRYPPQQLPQQQVRDYHQEMNYTKQQDQQLPLQRMYPDLTEQTFKDQLRSTKGLNNKPRTQNAFTKCYDSHVESDDEC